MSEPIQHPEPRPAARVHLGDRAPWTGPAAFALAALAHAGRRLAAVAAAPSSDEDPAEWLEQCGLAISWRGQLARLATLLTPLASSAVASALSAAA